MYFKNNAIIFKIYCFFSLVIVIYIFTESYLFIMFYTSLKVHKNIYIPIIINT